MPIPNTITRTLDLAHPQEKVWAALTTLDGITGWFGSHADGEIAPGRDVQMRWEKYDATATLAIKVVDPMSVFAQLPDAWLEPSYQGNVEGWRSELDELVAYLDAA